MIDITIATISTSMLIVSLIIFIYILIRELIREHKKNIQIIAEAEAKSIFIRKFCHEFRDSMNGIIGFSDILNTNFLGDLNHKQKARIKDIHSCGIHLQTIVLDLIELSKSKNGRLILDEQKINLVNLIEKTIKNAKNKTKLNDIKIELNINTTNNIFLGDESKVTQILKNVMDSVIKFTNKSSIVHIDFLYSDETLRIRFSSSSLALPLEDLEKLSLNNALSFATIAQRQLDLALAVARFFTELHAGRLDFNLSKVDKAITISITLPNNIKCKKTAKSVIER